MDSKPFDQKGAMPTKPAEKPGAPMSKPGETVKSSPAGPGPGRPAAAGVSSMDAKTPPKPAKTPARPSKGATSKPVGKKKVHVTPAEVKNLQAALLEKLKKAPEGLRAVDLAKQLRISTSKLTFIALPPLKKGEIKKVEVKDRVVYCSKDAAVVPATMDQEKVFKDVLALLKATPKGMKIADMAAKTKHTRQKLAAAMKPHLDSGVLKRVNDVYLLTGKSDIEAAKGPAPTKPSLKPELKKAPEKREPPKVPPRPAVKSTYRPPARVRTGRGIAWLALILAIVSIVMWVSVWGHNAATQNAIATLKQNVDQKVKATETSIAKMRIDLNARLKTADMRILNTFFNEQIKDLQMTFVQIDSLARMTKDEATLKQLADTKNAVSGLIQELRREYANTVPK
ncbi:MAG TPA: hypothetical protein VM163_13820 [bacterium]|nr:hypothetical protein [bacterium]